MVQFLLLVILRAWGGGWEQGGIGMLGYKIYKIDMLGY